MKPWQAMLLVMPAMACTGGDGADMAKTAAPKSNSTAACKALEPWLDDVLLEFDIPGALLAVQSPSHGECVVAVGVDGNENALEATSPIKLASITKTFTAAVIMQLAEQGALSLDDPLSAYYAQFQHASVITLRQLLNHTSGVQDVIVDFVSSDEREAPHEPEDVAAMAGAKALSSTWLYSNVNFILLGLVIEAITGNRWEDEVRTRLLERLSLDHTFFATLGEGPEVDWYLHPTISSSAGSMVSDASDTLYWLRALFDGEVLTPSSVAAMMASPVLLEAGHAYGLGLESFDVASSPAGRWGHTGNGITSTADSFRVMATDTSAVLHLHKEDLLYLDTASIAGRLWAQMPSAQ
jgi:D-alanyl-D-alanine carboxypeptidase